MMNCRNCNILFIPESSRHKFCSEPCKKETKSSSRKRYRTLNKEKIMISSKIYTLKSFDKRRNYHLKKNFNISLKEYNELFDRQNNRCKICKELDTNKVKHFAVDHCHNTNKVRGILCNNCNRAIGLFKDSKELLQNAINYLNEDKE